MLSYTEENYLKSIYHQSNDGNKEVSTSEIASSLDTSPASVTDMIKKLSAKKLLDYERYRGVRITNSGKLEALKLIRKHRLWETFLVQKLNFSWDEVHEVAEQLEHIKSPHLISQMDKYLGFPKIDPHGDPIPDKDGVILEVSKKPLSELELNCIVTIVAVNDSASLLKFLNKIGIVIGSEIEIYDRLEFDGSLEIEINGKKKVFISSEVAENIMYI